MGLLSDESVPVASRGGQGDEAPPLSLDSFRDATKHPGSKCQFGQVLKKLNENDRAAVIGALADESITAAAIGRVLSDAGHRLGRDTVQRHRRGECRCEKDGL